ncbi:MAG: hypothetical protein R6V57_07945 [Vicinamibacterales bacterium]
MVKQIQSGLLCAALMLGTAAHARAQVLTQAQTQATAQTQTQAATTATNGSDGGWDVAIYPVLVWVPLGIDINVSVPPFDGGGGGDGKILDGRFDGAFLGGFSVAKGLFRVDVDGLWAAVGGDRPDNPKLSVDVDAVYFHATGGIKIYKALYATGGVRRYALKYDVRIADQPNFSRKPGLWDPLVGIGIHHVGRTLEVHATFDGGGFGVGADVDLAAGFRLDWKPIPHFGLTGGYNYLYFRASQTVASRTFTFKQTLHGPIAGVGFYF